MSQPTRAADWFAYWRWISGRSEDRPAGIVGSVGPEDLLWEDHLTGTWFRAKAEDLQRIVRTALAALVRRVGAALQPGAPRAAVQEAVGTAYALLARPQGPWGPRNPDPRDPEAALVLLPHLPTLPELARLGGLAIATPGSRLPAPARLSDYVALRTGLFWALAESEIPPELWPALRLHALLAGIDRVCGVPEALPPPPWPMQASDAVARAFNAADTLARWTVGIPVPGGEGALRTALTDPAGRPYQVGLVKAKTVKIKEYFLQNNKIKAIRGASLLLDSINRERYPRFFACDPRLTPEGIIYCGGAGAMAVVPLPVAADAAAEWEKLHDRVTLAAHGVAVWAPVLAEDLALRFSALASQLEVLLEERRQSRIPWHLEPRLEDADPDLWSDGETCRPDLDRKPAGFLCHHCGMRRPVTQVLSGDEAEDLCLPCAIRVKAGSRRSQFWDLYERYTGRRPGGEPPNSLNELAEAHGDGRTIAVLYGDGNNVGAVVQRQDSAARMRAFSQRVEQAMYRAVFPALDRHLGTMGVEFVALGGDDLLFIMPAASALETAIAIGEAFDRQFYDPVSGRYSLTLSIGVAVAEYHTPVAHLFDAALQLMKDAKYRARPKAAEQAVPQGGPHGSAAGPGTVDVAVFTTGSLWTEGLRQYRQQHLQRRTAVGPVRLTLRPYTWGEARALLRLIRSIQSGGDEAALATSAVYALARAARELDPEEAALFTRYQLSRRRDESRQVRDRLRELASALGATLDGGTLVRAGERLNPWPDVEELWGCAAERADRTAGGKRRES